jgi:hypothetical protein
VQAFRNKCTSVGHSRFWEVWIRLMQKSRITIYSATTAPNDNNKCSSKNNNRDFCQSGNNNDNNKVNIKSNNKDDNNNSVPCSGKQSRFSCVLCFNVFMTKSLHSSRNIGIKQSMIMSIAFVEDVLKAVKEEKHRRMEVVYDSINNSIEKMAERLHNTLIESNELETQKVRHLEKTS